eukprot:1926310-Amphidinium_carterae.1
MWLLFSGVLAFGYNIFVTYVIQKLTPATTAFAGNFNKAEVPERNSRDSSPISPQSHQCGSAFK